MGRNQETTKGKTMNKTDTELLYKAGEAMDRARRLIEKLEAEVRELRAEIRRLETCCNCK